MRFDPDRALAPDLGLLALDEHAKAARFKRPIDRSNYIQAHAFLRRVLSRYADIRPESWQFEVGSHGKPAISSVAHPTLTSLCFSLSHCSDNVLVAVARDRQVGVDLERVDAITDLHSIAGLILSPTETVAYRALFADDDARRRFLIDRWTQKEAVLKALGLGLGVVEPSTLTAIRDPDGSVQVALEPGADQGLSGWPIAWWLQSGYLDKDHAWALASPAIPGDTCPPPRIFIA